MCSSTTSICRAPLVARATTIAPGPNVDSDENPDEPQTRRYFAWQAYLAADRACRLDPGAAAAPAIARARVLLSQPSLNCDHIRDPVTIAVP